MGTPVSMSAAAIANMLAKPDANNCMQCHVTKTLKNLPEMFGTTGTSNGFLSSAPMIYDPAYGNGPLGKRMVSYDINSPFLFPGMPASPVITFSFDAQGNFTGNLYKLLFDKDDNIWCTSNKGLYKFNPSTNKLTPVKYTMISDEVQGSIWITDIIQLNNVIDGLRRIGSSDKERMSDGVWDFRTTNAVKNVYAFANALVAASEALIMGGVANDPSMFKKTDLQSLGKAIPKEGASQEDFTNSAKTITPLVKKLTRFFDFYSKKVMNHPAYKRYIESDPDKNPNAPPLFSAKPGGVDPYKPDQNDPRQVEIMSNPKSFALPQLTLNGKGNVPVNLDGKVTLDYLSSRDGLISLMKNHLGYTDSEVNNGPLMRKVVNSILTQVNDFISKNSLLVKRPVATKPNVNVV
jgi:hypothetical protein